ncbi:hypothetical protein FHR20_000003 [Sphingomonas leidyi]|uniref:Uncharacterized protein n=1 Tax=Sphingomonas leidyi TaxID=68569 RepID=A0A7X5ZTH7_9SPHN|nr:hypothetical protein [Sphingomonas leidyi]NIJ63072.1 hypothetical protein [Sphingomonas leidyi]
MQPRIVESIVSPRDDEAAMAAFGIQRVPVDYFHWNGYRYSTLKDALAAARRAESRSAQHA